MEVDGTSQEGARQKKRDFLALRLGAPLLCADEGRPLLELLLDPGAPLAALTAAKEYGKALSTCADLGVAHDVGLAIYFAAIAAATVYYGAAISKLPAPRLQEAFTKLLERRWMEARLVPLLEQAKAACRGETGPQTT